MKIKVLSKKVITTDAKGKENVFYRYFTPVTIQVIKKHENGQADEDLGLQEKSLRVHFTKSALKKLDDEILKCSQEISVLNTVNTIFSVTALVPVI